jgi:hypothetical protein
LFQGSDLVRHLRLAVLLSTLILAFAGSALADTAGMSFTGPGGNNSGGVYTYPYEFVVTPGGSVALICDTFDNDVVSGETWTATVTSLLSGSQAGGGGLFAGQTLNYRAAGIIFEGILNGQIDANVGNWAIWGLFSADATTNTFYLSSGAGGVAFAAQLAALITPDSFYSNLVLYTPIAGTQKLGDKSVAGLPQEYIGIRVPEPAEIAMLMLMVIGGVMGFAFRQRLGLKLAVAQA